MEITDVLPRSQALIKELSEGLNGGLCSLQQIEQRISLLRKLNASENIKAIGTFINNDKLPKLVQVGKELEGLSKKRNETLKQALEKLVYWINQDNLLKKGILFNTHG